MEISGERMCEYSNNSKIINMQNMCEHEEGLPFSEGKLLGIGAALELH